MVEEGCVQALSSLSRADNDEVQQDCARALANLASNEDNHAIIYRLGAMHALIALTQSPHDVTQRYAAFGLRFLSSNPEVRVSVVRDGLVKPFIVLAQSPLVEYQRTAAAALASFTLNHENKQQLVRDGALQQLLECCRSSNDLEVTRHSTLALSNLCDAPDLQADVVREGGIEVLTRTALHADARVQRDAARALACLSASTNNTNNSNSSNNSTSGVRDELIERGALPALFHLARSLDVASQRYGTLALCNLASGPHKARIVAEGAVRPLMFLSRFPDLEIQRFAALALAGLSLGGQGQPGGYSNRMRVIQEGALRPLIELAKFPDAEVQRCATLALSAIALGTETATKSAVLLEEGLLPLLLLVQGSDIDTARSALYALGSLAECDEVKARLVELGAVAVAARNAVEGGIELKRAGAYFLALLCEYREFHSDVQLHGGLQAVVQLARLEDEECQEYAAFSLAHLASNHMLQVLLVELGALQPLVSMISTETEPKHYAGLALLKLADNFENHLRIAEAGGIQALLRLGRARSTDEELQYKAALTVGHLASNAVKLLPKGKGSSSSGIGAGAAMMHSISSSSGGNNYNKGAETALAKQQQAVAKRGQKLTQQYMDMALAK
jgi:Armadillo/beta-catenin-like repeat